MHGQLGQLVIRQAMILFNDRPNPESCPSSRGSFFTRKQHRLPNHELTQLMGKVAEMCVMPLSSKSVPGVNAPASDETFLDNRLESILFNDRPNPESCPSSRGSFFTRKQHRLPNHEPCAKSARDAVTD
jgi:hypothetical protein